MIEVVVLEAASNPNAAFEFHIRITSEPNSFAAQTDVIKAMPPAQLVACANTKGLFAAHFISECYCYISHGGKKRSSLLALKVYSIFKLFEKRFCLLVVRLELGHSHIAVPSSNLVEFIL